MSFVLLQRNLVVFSYDLTEMSTRDLSWGVKAAGA